MPRPRYDPSATPFARRLRRDATFPERLLWSRLRRRQLGVRFLRQRPVGRYIADFLAPESGLVVEVDGRSHDERFAQDMVREQYLKGEGLRIVRVTNDEVIADIEAVVERIHSALQDAPEASGDGEASGGSEAG